ncbi:phytanoyl-CoA dioxygenase [Salinivibrio sp. IB574]|uniref:phytanoyl-CoA dioxygenase family protein n=1 Tax=Salinivibrio sp. IB574 TaxID=1909444 RepID=UPI000989376B|nr:phytanoyl-CoA dioxygenase family protein [Salinivibrio sp. IB574]OOF23424.1 phytanoyl-CoA dioxygenase [Salinivibrio sp. IB574]
MAAIADVYPSRVNGKETLSPRLDPIVYGRVQPKVPHSLSQQELDTFERQGFLVMNDYMPEMVAPLKREITRLRDDMAGHEELYTEPDSDELRTIFKPFAYSDLIDRFSRDPRILNKVRQILGSDAYLMQSRVNIKPAFKGKSFPWHSDFETWHVEDGVPRMRAVTVWLMLTDNTEHNGPLYVIPGSHHHYVSCEGSTGEKNYQQSLKKQMLGVPKPETMETLLDDKGVASVTGKAGTLVFHDCNLMHGSPDNIANDPRSILMFVYNSVENKPVTPFSGLPPRPHYLSNPDQRPLQAVESLWSLAS